MFRPICFRSNNDGVHLNERDISLSSKKTDYFLSRKPSFSFFFSFDNKALCYKYSKLIPLEWNLEYLLFLDVLLF